LKSLTFFPNNTLQNTFHDTHHIKISLSFFPANSSMHSRLARNSLSLRLSHRALARLPTTTQRLGAAAVSSESSAAHNNSNFHNQFMRATPPLRQTASYLLASLHSR
jgi:hypothetical protein